MSEQAAMRPLGAFLRLTVAFLQTAAGRLRDRAFGTPVRTGSGADFTVRSASVRPGFPWRRAAGAALALFLSNLSWAQTTPSGTSIANTAQATFVRGSATPATVTSNTVVVVVEPQRTRAALQLVRPMSAPSGGGQPEAFGPTQCLAAGVPQALPPPVAIGGAVLNPAQPLPMLDTSSYHGGEAVFARIADADQNRDAAVRDTIDVRVTSQGGDSEVLRFTETTPASGVFVGYIQTATNSAAAGDCALQVSRDSLITSSYVDQRDATDSVQAQALVDPTGLVFDSRTGQPVSGARIRVVDAATGLPAPVLGDDGMSAFPSEIVSGAQATDSGATVYAFAPGAFRFPVVAAPAGYRFEIVPPAGHEFPSTATVAELATLPGAPFRVGTGSYGNPFAVDSPPAVNIDVPLDPASGLLFLDKSTLASVVSLGDFVQYTLRLQHAGNAPALAATAVVDVLPVGMRFAPGSVRIDDQRAADPQIAADGRTLTFTLGTLEAGDALTLRYVAEVTIGARGRKLVNRARAAAEGGSVQSNPASAAITLREDLNRDRAFIVGRVTDGGCRAGLTGARGAGVAGVRIYLEDGRYAVTDKEGKYHFEDVPAGTHAVQVDGETVPDTLEPVICSGLSRHAGRASSRFVDVSGGSMARADFSLDTRKPPQGRVDLALRRASDAHDEAPVAIELDVSVDTVAVGNARALVMLPAGVEYVRGSARISGRTDPAGVEPAVSDGIASFRLGELAPGTSTRVTFQVVQGAEVFAIGDGDFSLIPTGNVSPAGDRPAGAGKALRATVLFDSPTRNGQRIDPVELTFDRAGTGDNGAATGSTPTVGVIAMLKAPKMPPVVAVAPIQDEEEGSLPNLESLAPGIDWVLPEAGFRPAITSLKVALRHEPGQTVDLRINGTPVSALNFHGQATNKRRTVAVSLWRGVDIPEGTSELTAIVRDREGAEVARLTRSVDYASGPVRGELLSAQSLLVADGRTRPLIRLRLTDARGEPARRGTLGAFRVDAPHRSWFEVESLHENKLVATGHREPVYTVAGNGVAAIELEPTTVSGQVVVRLKFPEGREQEIRAWLEPAARDWIFVGLAEGTAAYRTISQNMETAAEGGIEEGFDESGRVALFAKGRIKGDFLLTLAYDSARETDSARARLNDVIEPQRYYTLYGDGTEQRKEAASREKLYLKLEREQFYALFGDFDTGLTGTELSRYARTLNGLQTHYQGESWAVNAFAARTGQNAVRDELRGDGTSGLYQLSRRPLIPGSDKLRIEVRDRFRTERILGTRTLARFLDYSIDYERGTVFFKEPVASRDGNFDFVFIIAEYETDSASSADTTAGGRAAMKFADESLEIGASIVHEGAQAGERSLGGLDARWRIGRATEVRAEVARSENDGAGVAKRATAYLAEATHVSGQLDGRVYVREQEAGFGLGQQLSTEAGTRKMGAEARVLVSERVTVQAETYRQEYLGEAAKRELASLEARYQDERYGAGIGVRHVADEVQGETMESQQAFAQASVDFNEQLRLRAATDFSLGVSSDLSVNGANDSIDYPSRAIVGLDWRFTPDITLFGEYEHAEGENIRSDMTRLGVKATPWNRARIQSTVSQEQTENGPRTFANLGLTQGFQLNERWALDVGLDQSNTIRGAGARPLSPAVPLASGSLSDDFLAAFAGALYRSERWTFTSRLEHRASDLEDRFSFAGGFYREPVRGHAFSLSTLALNSESLDGTGSLQVDIRMGWAYRPADSGWVILDRLDLVHEALEVPGAEQTSARIINSLNANWQLDSRTEIALQYGARYSRTTIDGDVYSGFSDLYGADVRRDIARRFDIGVHATALNSWKSHVHEYALGMDFGMTLARNVWIAVGYNVRGFRDEDFSANRYTEQGPFIKLRIKADAETFKDFRP